MVCLFEKTVAIKRVQRRATSLVGKLKDLNHTERQEKLDLPTLKYRRFRGDVIQMYEIINQIDDLKFDQSFALIKSDITRNARYKLYVEYSLSLIHI